MNHPPSVVRLAIVSARQMVSEDTQLPLYGALMFACRDLERGSQEAASELYATAKKHIDQSERLFVLDVALQLLPNPEENNDSKGD